MVVATRIPSRLLQAKPVVILLLVAVLDQAPLLLQCACTLLGEPLVLLALALETLRAVALLADVTFLLLPVQSLLAAATLASIIPLCAGRISPWAARVLVASSHS